MKNEVTALRLVAGLFLLSLFLLALSCKNEKVGQMNPDNVADSRMIKILEVLEELASIRYSVDNQIDQNRSKVAAVVNKLDDPDDLMTFAVLSKHLASSCADAECFKASNLRPTFETAFWEAVKKLAVKKEENKRVLDTLKLRTQLTGTDIGDWDRIVDGKEFP